MEDSIGKSPPQVRPSRTRTAPSFTKSCVETWRPTHGVQFKGRVVFFWVVIEHAPTPMAEFHDDSSVAIIMTIHFGEIIRDTLNGLLRNPTAMHRWIGDVVV
ncbi:hypothetical protein Pla52o_57660 [Novipirellula galeiformis]|uniref:Uncharacterized protein n=1 Tax=Novipirellula galeiformis TaxID=2528004 RepID=A0A5C6BEA3_9BACT|nr:hypothetical protein Pla52o_57660 [Novipirellula galeiformis]